MKTKKTDTSFNSRRRVLNTLGFSGAALGLSVFPQARASLSNPEETQSRPTSECVASATRIPYLGIHQAGIVTPRPTAGMMASFLVLAENRQALEHLFQRLTQRIAFLTTGGTQAEFDPKFPPTSSGLLGPSIAPDALTITVSVGATLFDARFGLQDKKPVHLQRMPSQPNDALDAALCHGDLSIQFCANFPDTNIHALRDIIKNTPDLLLLHWKQEGTVSPTRTTLGKKSDSPRNYLGFRDGSANPDAQDNDEMNRIVWVQANQGEPRWATHGSYQVVRIIRNLVERWDRTPLQEQEAIFGRRKTSGAPSSGGLSEHDEPDYTMDPTGEKTALTAHIRLANPRTAATQDNLILRRPFNYSNGVSKSGQLDMGLLFICYQANLKQGFMTVQNRLNGEPLEEYIKPVGGGFFYTLPGITSPHDWLGSSLLND